MGGSSGASSSVKFPVQFDYLGALLGESQPGTQGFGIPSEIFASRSGPLDTNNIFGPGSLFSQNFNPLMQAGFNGGNFLRDLGSQETQRALIGSQNLADLQGNTVEQLMSSLNPAGFANASASFGRGINQGLNNFSIAQDFSNQALTDVFNPTGQNPLFQNAANLLTPRVRAAFSARGLGSGGAAIEEEGNQLQQLADSFAIRNAQERQQALGTAGQLAQGQGQLGVQGAQVPAQVFSLLSQGGLAQQQALLAAQQGNLAPLQALQQGGGVFQQGLDMGLANFQNLLALRNTPMNQAAELLAPLAGSASSPKFLSSLGIPKS